MDILVWIIFGALAGWIASMFMKTDASQGLVMDVVMGIVGAIVGGFVMNFFGKSGVNGFNVYSLAVAIAGACIVIYLGRMFRKG